MLQLVPICDIIVKPQVRKRFDQDSIRGLAASIETTGLQQPIVCAGTAGGGILLVDGERRLRAFVLLGRTEIPSLITKTMPDAAMLIASQLVSNLQREDLDAVARAEAIRDLMAYARLTTEQAAGQLGLSSASVAKSLGLLKLPAALLDRVADGEISADAAYQLSRVEDPAEQALLAERVAGNELTRDKLARVVGRRSGRSKVTVRRRARARTRKPAAPRHEMAHVDMGEGCRLTVADPAMSVQSIVDCVGRLLEALKKAASLGQSFSEFASEQSKGKEEAVS